MGVEVSMERPFIRELTSIEAAQADQEESKAGQSEAQETADLLRMMEVALLDTTATPLAAVVPSPSTRLSLA